MDKEKIKILIIDDSENDALTLVSELTAGGYEVVFERINSAGELKESLNLKEWTAIIAAFQMKNFSAFDALHIFKEMGMKIPFFIVSSQIGENEAVEMMKAGAHDFFPKNKLARLVPAIKRELRHKRAEAMLQESEEKYRRLSNFNQRILDNAPVSIMVIDTDGKITAVNKFFINFGRTEKNPVGRNISEVSFFLRHNLIEVYQELFVTGKPFTRVDCQTVNSFGETKYINIIAVPFKNLKGEIEGAISMASDNTETHYSREKLLKLNRDLEKEVIERRLAEQEIRLLSEINQKILDNVPVNIVMVDQLGEILAANKMALDLFENGRRPMYGHKLQERDEFKKNKELSGLLLRLLEIGKPFYFDNLDFYQEAGITKHLNILAVPLLDSRGRVEGAIWMATDNTEAVEAKNKLMKMSDDLENKIKESTREFQEINQRLSNILDLKSKFVADASHELRTPMTVIQGNIELAVMEAKNRGQKVPEIYSIIIDEVERMKLVLSDLSMITKENKESIDDEKLKFEKVNLDQLAATIERSLKVIAQEKKIEIIKNECREEISIIGDNAKLEKLFLNILHNAIKYTDPNGRIEIILEKSDSQAVVRVKDTGIGIPEEDLPFIFDRFYRVDKARTRDETGSGLGLSIAKLVVEAHQGTIEVASRLGQGTIFTIRLPFDCRG